MLVNLEYVLKIAEEKNCAIGSFNTPNLENMIAVILFFIISAPLNYSCYVQQPYNGICRNAAHRS